MQSATLSRFCRVQAHIIALFCLIMTAAQVQAVTIDAVYFAQTHVQKPDHQYFGLQSDRAALIKVHVVDPAAPSAPSVTVLVQIGGQSKQFALSGPRTLPTSIPDGPGIVQHSFDNTFTTTIPAAWVRPGMQVTVTAGSAQTKFTDLKVGAPNSMPFQMYDFHFFGLGKGHDYPAGTVEEMIEKWPVAKAPYSRTRQTFPRLVMPPGRGAEAVLVSSEQDYIDQTGLAWPGAQSRTSLWGIALKRAGGYKAWRVQCSSYYGFWGGGQGGNWGGVSNGRAPGLMHHEMGHGFNLPHWSAPEYPYVGPMYGIEPPAHSDPHHAGPTWAYDSRLKIFIPCTTQEGNLNGVPVGTYKWDPMAGGGQGAQEKEHFILNHFSDYSVYRINDFIQRGLAVWNEQLSSYALWNETDGAYTTKVSNNGIEYPIEHDVPVIGVMAEVSAVTPEVCFVYPPIPARYGGYMKLFDPRSASDRSLAQQIFAPGKGCDVSVRVTQTGAENIYMLPAAWDPSEDPLDPKSLQTKAVNVRASDGDVIKTQLLLTPDAEVNGLPSNPEVLAEWDLAAEGMITDLHAARYPNGIYLTWENNWELTWWRYSAIEVRRNGVLIATLGPTDTTYLDTTAGVSGTATYELIAKRGVFRFDPAVLELELDSLKESLVVYEPFADLNSSLAGNTPGAGLTGTWQTYGTFKTNDTQIVDSSSLSFGDLPVSGGSSYSTHGGWPNSNRVDLNRDLFVSGLMDDGAEVWFSFVAKNASTSITELVIGTERIFDGTMPDNGEAIGVDITQTSPQAATWRAGSKTKTATSGVIPTDRVALVVGKITWGSGSSQPDTVEIYLPGTDLALPSAPVSAASAVLDQSAFDTLCFYGRNEGGPTIDEIRFGSTYKIVVGDNSGGNNGQNKPPVAKITATPTNGTAPLDVAFSSVGSSDSDGTIAAYRWDFGTGSGSSKTGPSHLYDEPGVYTATLTVTDDDGATDIDSVTIRVTDPDQPSGDAVLVNFQPADAPTVSGYLVDAGDAFGSRGNGQSYGWNTDVLQTRDRNTLDDQLLDTLNHAQYKGNTYTWEIAVENGDYEVTLACSDPNNANMIHDWVIEDETINDPDGLDTLDIFTVTVTVSDGRLTLTPAATAENAKISYVEVRSLSNPDSGIWLEDFADLSDGTQRDTGPTDWRTDVSALDSSARFGVQSGAFHANDTGGVGLWKTGQIDISGLSDVQVSVDIQSQGPMENTDFIEVSYRIDGGSEVQIARRTNNFNGDKIETISTSVESGTSVQVIIRAQSSSPDEVHVWDNISVSAASGGIEPILVNFQPADAPTVDGYLVDAGDAFGDRGNGQSYGWNTDVFQTRDRNTLDDQLLDTLNHAQYRGNTYTWELAVPNGGYAVKLVCSDPRNANMIHDWVIEGQTVYDLDGLDSLDELTLTVTVTDGRLTLTPAATAENAKISYVEVRSLSNPDAAVWLEAFADLSDGVQRDSGETAWRTDVSTLDAGAHFGVRSGAFHASDTGGVGLWKTEQIDITGLSNVAVSVDIQSQGPMENSDYIEVSYRIDGGSEVQIARRTNDFNNNKIETVSATVGSGMSVQVIIRAKTSSSDEIHIWDNISVSASRGGEADPVLVNFQPVDAPTVDGYLVDAGDAFGDRGNGQSYGWNTDVFQARDRNTLDDQLLDTLNHAQYRGNTYTWEVEIPNGDYEVTLTCSDPRNANMIHDWIIEGQTVYDVDGLDVLDIFTANVSVADGRLTLTPATTAENAKISAVEVRPAGATAQMTVKSAQTSDDQVSPEFDAALVFSSAEADGCGCLHH